MTVGEDSEGKEAAVDKFPAGMRVLAVDDDPVCLKLLESLLRHCKYHVTAAAHAETALKMLREGKDQFDLVISDVHMPDMDGFTLLEIIGLEMDLPVIMLSANGETKTVMKGITHGACDYLVKPVRVKELKNIWQHVVRRKPDQRNRSSGGNDDDDHKVQSGNAEGDQGCGKRTRKYSGKKRNDVDDSDENKENTELSTEKKPRVTWTSQLHRKFVEVVNQIGIEKAVPKKILDMMNVDYITRENVASHLQKYRLYLKRVSKYTSRDSNLFVDPSERWNSVYNKKNEPDSFKHYHEHGTRLPSPDVASSNSSNLFARMNSPSALGPHGLLTTQSIQLSNAQSNLGMGTAGHGGSLLKDAVPESLQDSLNGGPSNARNCFSSVNSFANSLKDGALDARNCFPSGPSGNSFANISNGIMLDASECFPSYHSGNSYASILRGKLLEASKGIPSCHSGNFFADISNGGILAPANQFPVQSPELGNQASVQMKLSSTGLFGTLVGDASQLPDPGNCRNSRQTVVQSRFPDLSLKDGTSLGPSQANIPKINQLASITASSGQTPMFGNEVQSQMAAIMSSTESMAGLSEQMAPFNIGSNTSSKEMLNDNFALGSASSISSALRNPQMDSFVMPTQMLNGGGTGGILPVQDGTADQQAVDDQLNYSNAFLIRANGPNGSGELEDIVAGLLNQDFIENDDAFMDGDWELVP